jgi:hypothetical protein
MSIEASYRRISAAEWDQLQQLQESSPTLPIAIQSEGSTTLGHPVTLELLSQDFPIGLQEAVRDEL